MVLSALPQGFSGRPATLEDVDAVVALLQVCDTVDRGSSSMTKENLLRNWYLPGVNLERDTWLVFAADGQLAAYIKLQHLELPQLHATPFVHPAYVHMELYAYLFDHIEEYARQFIVQASTDARVALNTFGIAKNRALCSAAEAAGFVHVRSSWNMQIDMQKAPPAPEWPAGIELRPFVRAMARAVHAADEEAFNDHWGYIPTSFEVFEQWFFNRPSFDPTLWFIPFENEQIVGAALCEYRGDLGWVGSLSIRRPWRRRGLAQALLLHLFGEFYRRGTRSVALFVDAESLTGATRLYERVGMHTVYQEDQYQKELRPGVEVSTQTLYA